MKSCYDLKKKKRNALEMDLRSELNMNLKQWHRQGFAEGWGDP